MQGAIIHRWQLPYRPGDYGYLLDNGHLLISGQTDKGPVAFGGRGGTVMEMDWDGHILWEYAEDTLHHDFCRMPNGHTMVLGWERIPADLARRVKGGTPGTEYEGGIWCDYFHEVTPDKTSGLEVACLPASRPRCRCDLSTRPASGMDAREYLRGLARRQPTHQLPTIEHRGDHRQAER
jgi:hypothetical protein